MSKMPPRWRATLRALGYSGMEVRCYRRRWPGKPRFIRNLIDVVRNSPYVYYDGTERVDTRQR